MSTTTGVRIRQGWFAFDGFNPVTEKAIWVQPAEKGKVYTDDEVKPVLKELRRRNIKNVKVEQV